MLQWRWSRKDGSLFIDVIFMGILNRALPFPVTVMLIQINMVDLCTTCNSKRTKGQTYGRHIGCVWFSLVYCHLY